LIPSRRWYVIPKTVEEGRRPDSLRGHGVLQLDFEQLASVLLVAGIYRLSSGDDPAPAGGGGGAKEGVLQFDEEHFRNVTMVHPKKTAKVLRSERPRTTKESWD
jgi:hypothetical protein